MCSCLFVSGQISAQGITWMLGSQCYTRQVFIAKDLLAIFDMQRIHGVPGNDDLSVTRPVKGHILCRELTAVGWRSEFGKALPLGLDPPLQDVAQYQPLGPWFGDDIWRDRVHPVIVEPLDRKSVL